MFPKIPVLYSSNDLFLDVKRLISIDIAVNVTIIRWMIIMYQDSC